MCQEIFKFGVPQKTGKHFIIRRQPIKLEKREWKNGLKVINHNSQTYPFKPILINLFHERFSKMKS